MKTALSAPTRVRSRLRRRAAPIDPELYSLMSMPFPVFVMDDNGRVVPTISAQEYAQLRGRCSE